MWNSYQDISLLAAVNEAQSSMTRTGMLLSFIWVKKMLSHKEAGEQVVVSKLKLDALRTTLLSYRISLLLTFADKQILNLLFRLEETGFSRRID